MKTNTESGLEQKGIKKTDKREYRKNKIEFGNFGEELKSSKQRIIHFIIRMTKIMLYLNHTHNRL